MLGPILVSLHNISYYQRLMSRIRTQIENGTFDRWADAFVEKHKNEESCKPAIDEGMIQ